MVESEEAAIFQLSKRYGKRWSRIALALPGRSENSIKNYFYSTVRKNIRMINKKLVFRQKLEGSVRELIKNAQIEELVCCTSKDCEPRLNAIGNGLVQISESILAEQTVEIEGPVHGGEADNEGELESQYQFHQEILFPDAFSAMMHYLNYFIAISSITQ